MTGQKWEILFPISPSVASEKMEDQRLEEDGA
jgi:hypothetical protein